MDDQSVFYAAAVIPGGISYNAGTGDSLTLVTAPMNTVATGVPMPFSVTALGADMNPAGGVTVIYTVTSGAATLSCGLPVCTVASTGDGRATMNVIANGGAWSTVTASLTNGASIEAQFQGGTPPVLAALTPQLSLAAGATFTWTVQAEALANGSPAANQSVTWQTGAGGIAPLGNAAVVTGANGIATRALTVGPLAEGQVATISACLNGAGQCVAFTAIGARPEYAILEPVAGTAQSLSLSGTPAEIVLRLYDMDGNPMAGGTVAYSQAIYAWTPPCAAHQVCAPGNLLAAEEAASTSAVDGSVSFAAASLPGVATRVLPAAAPSSSSSSGADSPEAELAAGAGKAEAPSRAARQGGRPRQARPLVGAAAVAAPGSAGRRRLPARGEGQRQPEPESNQPPAQRRHVHSWMRAVAYPFTERAVRIDSAGRTGYEAGHRCPASTSYCSPWRSRSSPSTR